jgi:hypothetical protein
MFRNKSGGKRISSITATSTCPPSQDINGKESEYTLQTYRGWKGKKGERKSGRLHSRVSSFESPSRLKGLMCVRLAIDGQHEEWHQTTITDRRNQDMTMLQKGKYIREQNYKKLTDPPPSPVR